MERFGDILGSYAVAAGQSDVHGTLLGASFTVYNDTGLVYSGGAGRQGFDVWSPAYSPDTVQWMASMTKLVTAVALLQLVDRGLITLLEDLRPKFSIFSEAQILTGFFENNTAVLIDNKEPITLWNLLTHTSGFAYDVWNPDLTRWSESLNRTENSLSWSYEGFKTPLVFVPSTSWTYGTSLDWAGYVLESLTNMTLENYMRESIFDPLGMESTSFNVTTIPNISCRRADWAAVSPNDTELLIPGNSNTFIPVGDFDMYSGGAGLFSTGHDYAKFLFATIHGDLVSETTRNLMFSPQLNNLEHKAFNDLANTNWNTYGVDIDPAGAPLDYGLSGVMNLEDSPLRRRKGSLFWWGAVNSRWFIDPETGIAAVLTTQVDNGGMPHPLTVELWRELELAVYQELG